MIFIHFLELTLHICLPDLCHVCWPISTKCDKRDQVSNTGRYIRALHNWSNPAATHLPPAALMDTSPLDGGYTTYKLHQNSLHNYSGTKEDSGCLWDRGSPGPVP